MYRNINNFNILQKIQHYQRFPLSVFVTKTLDITETIIYTNFKIKKYRYLTYRNC